ncbi:MAG TPA: hypothetical protein VMF57_06060 [Solirubrobacteraceae bacterium]|nr:hypothetical protein [Solirubrobacteraceae bacterium]
MRRSTGSAGQDVTALVAVAGVLLGLLAVTRRARLLRLLSGTAGLRSDPVAIAALALAVASTVTAGVARALLIRRLLADRAELAVLPSEDLDPAPEAVAAMASALGRVRAGWLGWLCPGACAARLAVRSLPGGRLAYTIAAPRRTLGVVRAALASYDSVALRDSDMLPALAPSDPGPAGEPASVGRDGLRVVRAELVLARRASLPLADRGLRPDPLAPIARVYESLRDDLDERAMVVLDVQHASPRQRRRLHREARAHSRTATARQPSLADVLAGRAGGRGRVAPVESFERRTETGGLQVKLAPSDPLLRAQLLIRVQSRSAGRARSLFAALLASFDAFAGENRWRARGLGIPGLLFWGSDRPGYRGSFERRISSGLFRPPRRNLVSTREIAGLLKPPSKHCPQPNVLRVAGTVAPAPAELPTFTADRRELVPLGRVSGEHGERLVGLRLADTFFSYTTGRSRYGKTELAIGQFIHLVRSGHGGLFLDPHEDAIGRIKAYLTDPDLARRVVEINLAGPAARRTQPGWNLFSMAGLPMERAEQKVEAVVDAFASALQWDERNNRALTLITQAAQALIELAIRLPDGLAPTLFQIPTLLGNDQWRTRLLPFLSAPTRQFFTDRFPRMSDEAITPVTNLIDRLRGSTPVAALLGSSTSSYRIRDAIDQGKIVLACPGSGTTRDRLIANFLVYDLLHAALGRAELPPGDRRPFYVFLDEVQTYDGASRGNLAALLEQTAKYGIRGFLLNQNPERLTQATLNAITTNRSHLITTVLNSHAAGLISREWGGTPDAGTIASLPRHQFLAAVTLGDRTPPPFQIQGVLVEELYPGASHPDQLHALEQVVDRSMHRRPVSDTLAQLDRLDQAILEHLTAQCEDRNTAGRPALALRDLPPRSPAR